ncbi:MAG: hypothetical protein ACXWDM_01970 [Nocardioides sp.]
MVWLELLTLPDGSRVESGLFAAQTADPGPAARAYRLRQADGSVTEFSTLPSTLRYLLDHYDPDDLNGATSHQASATHLEAGRHHAGADHRRRP